MVHISIEKAKRRFPKLLREALQGQEIIITQDEVPVLKLVSLQQQEGRPHFGSAKGMFTMADDFDAPIDDFEEYMQ